MSQALAVLPTTGPLTMAAYSALLNGPFAAILSKFSGATPPSTTNQPTSYQWWVDTSLTPAKLRIYDGSTAWPIIGQFSTAIGAFVLLKESSDSILLSTVALTLSTAHYGKTLGMNSTAAATYTIPGTTAVAWPIGIEFDLFQYSSFQTTIAAGSTAMTLRSKGGALKISAQYGRAKAKQIASNDWLVSGDLST